VAIDVEHLDFTTDRGVLVALPRSKTDQEAAGDTVPIHRGREPALCSVRALRAWLDAAQITRGQVFRRMHRGQHVGDRLTAQSVALIVKRRAGTAGLEPTKRSGHSLRAGYTTTAAARGIEERKIARVTRHKNLAVLRGYIRPETAFEDSEAVL
jgi:Phage integrase family